jgi:ATP-dependent RNA helicase DBP3
MHILGSALPLLTRREPLAGFSADLLHATRDFAVPSPIQMETWPVACAGRDVIGVAATGSGKTLAFGLPALAHTQAQLAAGVAQGAP